MTSYCPACLNTWGIPQRFVDSPDWYAALTPGVSLHVACGRALEALRTAPPTFIPASDDFPELRTGWAA